MERKILLIYGSIIAGFIYSANSNAGLIFYSGAESTWKQDRNCLQDDCWGIDETHLKTGHPYAVTIESSHNGVSPRAGNKFWKFESRPGDVAADGNCRNTLEQYFPHAGREYWVGYSMWIPSDFASKHGTRNSSLTGYGGEGGAYDASTRYGMRVNGSDGDTYLYPYQKVKFYIEGGSIQPGILNQWSDWVFHFTTGTGGNEFYEFWLNGNFKGRWDGTLWPTGRLPNGTVPDGWQMNFKPGLYGCVDSTLIHYFDEFRVWEDSGGSYAAVAPGGAPPAPTVYQCNDGIDNDADGKIDYPADPGCSSSTDNDETDATPPPTTYQCNDTIDNDGDDLIDYPDDPGCTSITDNDEFNEVTYTSCHKISSSINLPPGLTNFAPPYSLVDGNSTLLQQDLCYPDRAELLTGVVGDSTIYTYKNGYAYKNGAWLPITYTGTFVPGSTDWIVGQAKATVSKADYLSSNDNWHVAYICQFQDPNWKCGCTSAACTTSKWNVQYWKQ